ncbi:ankyrin repeat-containing protein BDA1-like [Alnus glutinosa]|uniref:ankyrin repeat-containing protein BDA1-like n=1 Tax=Alnus glutinosa TaxID=3517 RepID=UPI002D77E7C5|nr:ankyrin repeat-containing protein BDA1-like [Alnus glutinosa]
MDQSLRDAAQQGSIDALYALIQRDPHVLDRIDAIPFVETPLHTAAFAGHTQFAMEIMRLKPSFARKLNQYGFTPMHLALQNNQTQLVYRLVSVDKDLIRVQGKGGVTPLHYVVKIGNFDVLSKFLEVCPTSIKDVTNRGETILHISLNNHLHAFEYLLRWLQWTTIEDASVWEKRLLNWKDEEGNTVLHIAVSKNQPQVVRWLLNARVHINLQNLENRTALDILEGRMEVNNEQGQMQVNNNEMNEMIQMNDMLRRAGALNDYNLPIVEPHEAFLRSHGPIYSTRGKFSISMLRQRKNMTNDLRNMLLVILVLFITATYQAALSPPGGVWQDNCNPPTDQFNTTLPINVTRHELSPTPHKAGKVTMNNTYYLVHNQLPLPLDTHHRLPEYYACQKHLATWTASFLTRRVLVQYLQPELAGEIQQHVLY